MFGVTLFQIFLVANDVLVSYSIFLCTVYNFNFLLIILKKKF